MKELEESELKIVNGGFGPIFWLLVGVIVAECLDRHAIDDFKEGYADATK